MQGGQIHRDQLRSLGLNADAIHYRLRIGRLHRRGRGVYGVGHPRDDRLAILHAAVLTGGDGAALSHLAAAEQLRIRPASTGLIDVTVPTQRRLREGIRFHRRVLPADEVIVVDGLPLTSPTRTLFDLAGVLPERLFRRAVKEVEVQGLADRLSLVDLIGRHPKPKGSAVIRAIIDEGGLPATVIPSDGEDRFAELVAGAGIEPPSHRYGIALDGDWVEVDFAWPELRIAVEVDSSFHAVEGALEVDRARDQALVAAGWIVFRVTWRQLRWDSERVLSHLRRLLARAE